MIVLERLPYDPLAWEAIVERYPDAEVFQSPAWLAFLAASQGAEPVIAAVLANGQPAGHFVGAIVRRYGLRILGSPLRGWGTQSMGFLLDDGVDRQAAAEALPSFAFRSLGCVHVELADRRLSAEQATRSGYAVEVGNTFVVDLDRSEDAVLRGMRRTAVQQIRRALRQQLSVEVATDLEFAEEFHEYLTAVFARQGLAPTYGVERVRQLIRTVQPSGQLLLLRARGPDGATQGTSISVGRNRVAVAWGMAFDRDDNEFHPIELLWWETMRHWRERGALRFDMGGGGDYKAKYGGIRTPSIHLHRPRYAVLRHGRTAVRELARARQVVGGLRQPRVMTDRAGRPRVEEGGSR